MDLVLWVVALLALGVAWATRKVAVELREKLDRARMDLSGREADVQELKTSVDVTRKLLEALARGDEVDPLMVRENRLYRQSTAAAVASLVEEGQAPYVLDVRSDKEWATGRVPGAAHIPVDALESRLAEVRRDGTPIYVVCAGGGRSTRAAEFLANRGYLKVHNVADGMNAYKGPTERD